MKPFFPALLYFLLQPLVSLGFTFSTKPKYITCLSSQDDSFPVVLDPTLDDEKVVSVFAWLSRALAGDRRYDNLMIGMVAIFGDLPPDSQPMKMLKDAEKLIPREEECTGALIPRLQREQASLGAMGAGQWLGKYRTRPHSLLNISNFTSVEEWVKTLPRGCKRTLKKANSQNFTVTTKPIIGGQPAPHSSLSHFRCVVEHEVRLISEDGDIQTFFEALSEAIGRYQGSTQMTGEIHEYRNFDNKIIAFSHEIRKGNTIRGQWFYGNDESSKSYVWFHSVYSLVKRAIAADGVDVVDLGPSGVGYSELKSRYGFESIDDWCSVADYSGDFFYSLEDDNSYKNRIVANMMTNFNKFGQS